MFFFSNRVKFIIILSFVSGHICVKDIPTHYWWISLGKLVANKILVDNDLPVPNIGFANSPLLFEFQNDCMYVWNILHRHNTNPFWANGHSIQGL